LEGLQLLQHLRAFVHLGEGHECHLVFELERRVPQTLRLAERISSYTSWSNSRLASTPPGLTLQRIITCMTAPCLGRRRPDAPDFSLTGCILEYAVSNQC
jgi:hypothetical protein